MATWQSWLFWPNQPALSLLVLFLILLPFLYAARVPMHGLIRSVTRVVSNGARLASRWLAAGAEEMRQRNKVVLMAHAQEEVALHIEREFERIGNILRRDLQDYPALQRKLKDEVTRIEEDYRRCGEVPPPPPDWVNAIESVAKIKSGGSDMIQGVLEDLNKSVTKIHDKTVAEYRRSYEGRHKILKGMLPHWRAVEKHMIQADKKLVSLDDKAKAIDAQMEKFLEIRARSDKAEHALVQSSFVLFFISSLVLLIAAGGAFVNYNLIALPMSEMVGGGNYVPGTTLETSTIAALVIILVEASIGLFLVESLRITHLFPRISNMDERMRQRMFWISLILLVVLASIESALALMRDILAAERMAMSQHLRGADVQNAAPAVMGWWSSIPTVGQMVLGFMLPFALAFMAIPLEMFVSSLRTVGGVALVQLIRLLSLLARVIAAVFRQIGHGLIMLYDFPIYLLVLVERAIRRGRDSGGVGHRRTSGG